MSIFPRISTTILCSLVLANTSQAALVGFSDFQLNQKQAAVGSEFPYLNEEETILTMMDSLPEASISAFSNEVQEYASGFVASFTYEGGFSELHHGIADGFTFTLQNAPSGAEAIGNHGGALGFEGAGFATQLDNAVAITFNIAGGSRIGYAFNHGDKTGQIVTSPDLAGLRLDFSNDNDTDFGPREPVNITITYNPGVDDSVLSVTATQLVGGILQTFNHNYDIGSDIRGIVGGTTAYVGFTAASGGDDSSQVISNFSYTSVPEPSTMAMVVGALGVSVAAAARRRIARN